MLGQQLEPLLTPLWGDLMLTARDPVRFSNHNIFRKGRAMIGAAPMRLHIEE